MSAEKKKDGRGGRRPGAGRPKRELVNLPMDHPMVQDVKRIQGNFDGLTSLDVMMQAIADEYEKQIKLPKKRRDWKTAVAYASMAAPFQHPRLGAVAVADKKELTAEQILEGLNGRTRGLPSDTGSGRTIN